MFYYMKYSVLKNFVPLIKMIISQCHVRLFMVISHVTIITDSALCFNAILGAILGVIKWDIFYIINRIIHGCLEI